MSKQTLVRKIFHRNNILLAALFLGFALPGGGQVLSAYTIYLLMIVMSFSTTGLKLRMLTEIKSVGKITFDAAMLNYLIFGALILIPAYFFLDEALFLGFVVIAATPPGVAIIPFTHIYNGDLDYSFKGILGTFLLSIVLTPLIIGIFAQEAEVAPVQLVLLIVKVIVLPIAVSRLLTIKKIYPTVEKMRGRVVDFGFALIIYTAVAVNSQVILANPQSILGPVIILFVGIFLSAFVFEWINLHSKNKKRNISRNLFLTIKSSGFSIATALALFKEDPMSTVPAAVLSIFVLLYLIAANHYFDRKEGK
ncbi:MAG: hypothetical protein CSB06_00495 [Bacteroidia bacterium]|nr:MAG: hypothetical protein CSB06_00495 [Bacteroidia bacterium]